MEALPDGGVPRRPRAVAGLRRSPARDDDERDGCTDDLRDDAEDGDRIGGAGRAVLRRNEGLGPRPWGRGAPEDQPRAMAGMPFALRDAHAPPPPVAPLR